MTVIPLTPRSPSPDWTLLSPREAEVLHLVAADRSNTEIAGELFISVATVKTHLAQLLRKVRARDRVGLVVTAYTSGFVPVGAMARGRRQCSVGAPRQPRHWMGGN